MSVDEVLLKYFALTSTLPRNENSAMTIFDLLFIVSFLFVATMIGAAAITAIRGRRQKAIRVILTAALFIGLYFVVVIVVSLATPRHVLALNQNKCWDEFCLGVTGVQRIASPHGITYEVNVRVGSRALGRPQRGLGATVYVLDNANRRYDAIPDSTAIPLDIRLQPQEAMVTTRKFELPTNAGPVDLVLSHGGGFPTCCIIGDDASLLHQPIVVKLD
jgi:hypothetical protein